MVVLAFQVRNKYSGSFGVFCYIRGDCEHLFQEVGVKGNDLMVY